MAGRGKDIIGKTDEIQKGKAVGTGKPVGRKVPKGKVPKRTTK